MKILLLLLATDTVRWAGYSDCPRAGRSGIESRWGRDFPPVQTGAGAHPASCTMGIESFPGVKCGRGLLLTTQHLLVSRSRKSRASSSSLHQGPGHMPQMNRSLIDLLCNPISSSKRSHFLPPVRPWQRKVELLRGRETFRDLLHAANLRHGTDGFTSLPKEGVLRIFPPLKIRRLRPGLKPRTWVPKASTLPLDHRSRL